MTQSLILASNQQLPLVIGAAEGEVQKRFFELFTVPIRNKYLSFAYSSSLSTKDQW
jgi:hypothetical protein